MCLCSQSIRALGLVVTTDALVLAREAVPVDADAKRLVTGDGVIEQAVSEEHIVRAAAEEARNPAGARHEHVAARRVVRRLRVQRDRERALLLPQRAGGEEAVVLRTLRALVAERTRSARSAIRRGAGRSRRRAAAPTPGCVMMSMNSPPAEWFSAANASRVMWMDLICDFGGSCPPSKLSIRSTASGPAMSWSIFCISAGSSESASICSRVIAVPNCPFRSAATAWRSRPTVTSDSIFWMARTICCLLSPARSRTSLRRPCSNPGNSARICTGREQGPGTSHFHPCSSSPPALRLPVLPHRVPK